MVDKLFMKHLTADMIILPTSQRELHRRNAPRQDVKTIVLQNLGMFEVGLSENSVPLNPMVLLIMIPFLNGYFIGNIPYFQTNPYEK